MMETGNGREGVEDYINWELVQSSQNFKTLNIQKK